MITTTKNKISYVSDGTATTYSFDFPAIEKTDIEVFVYDLNNNKTELTYGTDYSVTLNSDNSGGNVTLTNPANKDYTILIYREVPYTQETVYMENSPFPAKSHENALDKLTLLAQQLYEKFKRTLNYDPADEGQSVTLPPMIGGGFLGTTADKKLTWKSNVDYSNINLKVNTIQDLLNVDLTNWDGVQPFVVLSLGYHTQGDGGGGVFYWDANEDKANHNGGTIIDPTKTFPTDWSDTAQQDSWFNTTNTGSGCWKRIYYGEVYVDWFGSKGDGVTDDTIPIQKIINILDIISSQKIIFSKKIYKITKSLTFSDNGTGYIKNITIQGVGSGLASGNVDSSNFGTTFHSYISNGSLFDLTSNNATCINVQFKDFECYDKEGTSTNYGIKAYFFSDGCIIENVGFKNFSISIYITQALFYSKIDRVSSFYARDIGMNLQNINETLLNRIQCSNSTNDGLYIGSSLGSTILGGWFEGNGAYGIDISKSIQPTINSCYFEANTNGDIYIGGDSSVSMQSGVIQNNNFNPGNTTDNCISLGYVNNVVVYGNRFGHISLNGRAVYSAYCENCIFIGNNYNVADDNSVGTISSVILDVPDNNYIIEPQLGRLLLPNSQVSRVTAKVSSSSATIPASTWTVVPFDAVTEDVLGEFDLTNYKFVAKNTGVYQINANVSYTANFSANSIIGISKNGSLVNNPYILNRVDASQNMGYVNILGSLFLNKGESVEIMVEQTSTDTQTIQANYCYFNVVKIQ